MTDVSGQLPSIPEFIAAAGALGTAAYGLVDASKFIAGGMSNPGFGFIRKAVRPLLGAAGDYGPEQILATLKANWLNGMAKADQKAVAKSLIRLGLTSGKAELLAKATGVDAGALATAAKSVTDGAELTVTDMNVLGRFDAVVCAILDLGYERADQLYRNAAKAAAALVAVVLAVAAGALIHNTGVPADSYFPNHFFVALLVGLVSTPLAPVAKDVSTALTAAVKAVGAFKS
jgi:hypothetical protein